MLCWDRLTVDSLPRADGARFWFGLQAAASREHRFGSQTAAFAWKEQPCERHRVRRGAPTRVTSRQADRPALHPWSHEHPGAGAESLGMRGLRGAGARAWLHDQSEGSGGFEFVG